MKGLLALLGALAAVVVLPIAAAAGGWAVTYLDPLPEHIQSAKAYTIGYWVLQHGSHPSVIPLTETGLRLTSPSGEEKYYRGMPLREVAHFAVAVLVPHDGTWTVEAVQQPFGPYKVGELRVPGAMRLFTTPTPMVIDGHAEHAWGEIHPPQMATDSHVGHSSTVTALSAASAKEQAQSPRAAGPLVLAALGGMVASALLMLVGRRFRPGAVHLRHLVPHGRFPGRG